MAKSKNKQEYYSSLFSEDFKKRVKSSGNRSSLLKGIPLVDIIEYASDMIPDSVKDDKADSKIKKKIKSGQKNTGIYLWMNGYDPIKLLGVGANGVVWECKAAGKNIAVKVTCDRKRFGIIPTNASEDEIEDSKVLSKIVGQSEEEVAKASEYLFLAKHNEGADTKTGEKRAVFETELADKGDLEHYKFLEKKYGRFLGMLKTANNVLNALVLIHEAGFSHNDVKPDNLLAVSKASSTTVGKLNAKGNDEEVVVKLADFGAVTKIKSKWHQKMFVNRYFCAPDMQNIRSEAVAKRDVYSLGAVLVYLFVGCSKEKAKDCAKKLEKTNGKFGLIQFCRSWKDRDLAEDYDLTSGGNKAEKILAFLNVVRQMVASSYKNRLDVNTAYKYMRDVSAMPD